MAIIHCLVLVFLYATPVMGKVTVFHTNCSRPASGSTVNFVTAANTRGTLEILWSSIFTLVICTWTVQHLSVPPQDMKIVDALGRKVRWMMMSVVVPEILVGFALSDFVAARASLKNMQKEFPELVEEGGWSITHAFYANMGGFVLREMIVDEPSVPVNDVEAGRSKEQETSRDAAASPARTTFRPICVLDSAHIISSLKSGLLAPSFITKEEIRDKSKGDFFLKLTAAFQLLWLIVQVCARKAQNLSTSQLEIAVLAFCVCAFVCYLLWFKKPQGVGVPTYLDAARLIDESDQLDLEKRTGIRIDGEYGKSKLVFSGEAIWQDAIIVNSSEYYSHVFDMYDLGIILGGTVFGAIHLLAWNLHFPTHNEKILWRVSSLFTTVMPTIFYGSAFGFSVVLKWQKTVARVQTGTQTIILFLGILFYGICRLFIMVEVFRSLGFLPAEAFVGTWSTYMPHVT